MSSAPSELISEPPSRALRVPPHSIPAEQAVLGGVLLHPASWDQIVELLSEEDFYHPGHRLLFRAIAALRAETRAADFLTLAEWLRAHGELEKIGVAAYTDEYEILIYPQCLDSQFTYGYTCRFVTVNNQSKVFCVSPYSCWPAW